MTPNPTTTAPTQAIAFYFRTPGSKRWRLEGVYDSAEQAWAASLELKVANVDLWFPAVDQAEVTRSEVGLERGGSVCR